MISGIVNVAREAVVPVVIRRATDGSQTIQAIIDTGFTGELSLPAAAIEAIGLTWGGRERAMLADGSIRRFEYYEAVVDWDGSPRPVVVFATESDPLIGMALLDGYELTIQAVPGGTVTITALSSS